MTTRQMVCEGACSGEAFRLYQQAEAGFDPADRDPQVVADIARYIRACRYTPHQPVVGGEWRCVHCGTVRGPKVLRPVEVG